MIRKYILLQDKIRRNSNKKEQNVEKFSEKSLLSLGDYYVYGLIDPRNRKLSL